MNSQATAITNEMLYELLQKIDRDLQDFKKEMHGFKDEMYGFQKEMHGFQKEMYGFKNEMCGFRQDTHGRFDQQDARLDAFKKEMYGFQKEMHGFRQDVYRRFDQQDARLDAFKEDTKERFDEVKREIREIKTDMRADKEKLEKVYESRDQVTVRFSRAFAFINIMIAIIAAFFTAILHRIVEELFLKQTLQGVSPFFAKASSSSKKPSIISSQSYK